MAKRDRVSEAVQAEALFSEVTVERNRSERDLARDHVIGRNRRVGATFCFLSLMRGAGLIDEGTAVTCRAARLQDFQSSGDNEAAHYVPGQIFLKTRGSGAAVQMHELVSNAGTREHIASIFSRVQDLHQNFNKADTYAESYAKPSLKKLFAEMSKRIVRGPSPMEGKVGANVKSVYDTWARESAQVYQYAVQNRTARADIEDNPLVVAGPGYHDNGAYDPNIIDLDASEANQNRAVRRNRHGQITATATDYSDQIRYLSIYAEFAEAPALTDHLIRDTERLFRV